MTEPAKAEHVWGVLDVLAYVGDHGGMPVSGVNAEFVREVKAALRVELARLRTIETAVRMAPRVNHALGCDLVAARLIERPRSCTCGVTALRAALASSPGETEQ